MPVRLSRVLQAISLQPNDRRWSDSLRDKKKAQLVQISGSGDVVKKNLTCVVESK